MAYEKVGLMNGWSYESYKLNEFMTCKKKVSLTKMGLI
jgi:CRISPR/Cas system-associated exonuclease Cas4 (RecB family)